MKTPIHQLEALATIKLEDSEELVGLPLETLPVGVPIPCPIYLKFSSKFIPFRDQKEQVSSARFHELQVKGMHSFYIQKIFWDFFLEFMGMEEEDLTEEERCTHIRQYLLTLGRELERRYKDPKKPYFEQLKHQAAELSDLIRTHPKLSLNVLSRCKDSSMYFIVHAVNVAAYSSLIGEKLGLTPEDNRLLCYSALVHNVGSFSIPAQVLTKSAPLTEDDWLLIKHHTVQGAEFLSSISSPAPVVLSALQHHENVDGKGYPQKLKKTEIHLFAKIISVADVYDALLSDRPHTAALTPQQAIETMRSQTGKFDPEILPMVGF